jgi:hypothetical protein
MNSVLNDLYNGKITGWERGYTPDPEERILNEKIEDERRHFVSKMSLDDVQRFEKLENLFSQSHDFRVLSAFRFGYSLGTLISMEVLNERDR